MHERTTLAVAVAVFTLLAGCGGVLPTDGPAYGDTTTLPEAADGSQAQLQSADSFRYNVSTVLAGEGGPGQQVEQNVSARVNLSSGALYVRQRLGERATVEGYTDGNGSAARRLTSQGQSRVERVDASQVNVTGYTRPNLNGLLDGLNYTHRGTTERDGATLHNYTASADGLGLAEPQVVGPLRSSDVTSVESRLLVTEDGVIRSLTARMRADGGNTTYTYRVALGYDGVGSTTVTRPDWAAQASE